MRRLTALGALALAAACARQEPPPGGPPRNTPPDLLSVSPESGAVNVQAKNLSFTFDEVVSERPSLGGQTLGDLFLISPRDGVPRIGWHRQRIDVRGDRPWKANTAYTITMRAGLTDLHGNVLKHGYVIVFSTGAAIPATAIRGVVFDWATGKPVSQPLVQVYLPPDSTQYVTVGDSSGHFTLLTLPPGPRNVVGIWDQNNNRALDPREAWDTATVQLTDSATVELYAFVHDTIGPHLSDVSARDSLTIRATFDKPVDIAQHLDTSTFVLRARDSSIVPLTFVGPWRDYEKARIDSIAHADSIAALTDSTVKKRLAAAAAASAAAALKARQRQRDTTPKAPPPVPTRPLPNSEYVLFSSRPLGTGTSYHLEARSVRNLLGDTASSVHSLQIPKPPPPPPPPPPGKSAPGGAPAAKDSTKPSVPAPAAPVAPPPAPPPPKPPRQ